MSASPLVAHVDPHVDRIDAFMDAIEALRADLGTDDWTATVRRDPVIRRWRYFLAADPYTRWGLVKPRGYPGDATLMDFAYGHATVTAEIVAAGTTGRAIYERTSAAPQSASARLRIAHMARSIEDLCGERGEVRITSFAAGHARELESLSERTRTRIARFTALDNDARSIEQARSSARGIPFVGLRRNVIKDRCDDVGACDLVYSLGLFDYLADDVAAVVLGRMIALAVAGARVVVANLAPDARNLAYCEAIMDWWMVTRDERQLIDLATPLLGPDGSARVERRGCFNHLEIACGADGGLVASPDRRSGPVP